MEDWSIHKLNEEASPKLGQQEAFELLKYAQNLMEQRLPVIFTLKHLANITNTNYKFLYESVNRKREYANYRMFSVKKRSGGHRFIHAVSKKLLIVQKFINSNILKTLNIHRCSFAYHSSGGIKNCAAKHCGARWIFQFDLSDFFYSVSEIDVYKIFQGLGYSELLSFELARLCTTIRLPKEMQHNLKASKYDSWDKKYEFYSNYKIGVLPQGAPTSPMLSNLVAGRLDDNLRKFALNNGFIYTRYADDLTFSTRNLPANTSVNQIRKQVISIIRKSGFRENKKKIRIAGPGAKKIVLGLLVDEDQPRISKETYKRIDRLLYAIKKFGLTNVAKNEKFESAYGLYNHLSGLIAYLNDVDINKWKCFNEKFLEIKKQYEFY